MSREHHNAASPQLVIQGLCFTTSDTIIHFDPFKGQKAFLVSASGKQFAFFYIIMLYPTLCSGFVVNPFADFEFWKETHTKD